MLVCTATQLAGARSLNLLLISLQTANLSLCLGAMLSSGEPSTPHLDFLLRHSLKMLNIYYHLVTNQRPPSGSHSASSKAPKSELFAREQPGAAALQALGYFAGDYVYMKLYNILRGANDSYKVSQATDSQIRRLAHSRIRRFSASNRH